MNRAGRSKNVWESPPGCLMFSFTSQMLDAQKLPLMQYVVCLSITEAIKELCRAKVRIYFSVVMFAAY